MDNSLYGSKIKKINIFAGINSSNKKMDAWFHKL